MNLPILQPDAAREHRVKALCLSRLERHRRRRDARDRIAIRIERTVLLGFCAVYLTAAALSAVQVLIR